MRVKKSVDVPVIGPKDLTDADGILFGFPIRYCRPKLPEGMYRNIM